MLLFFKSQGQQGWMAGAAPSLELDHSLFGLNGRLYYGPDPSFCFGPEVAVFPFQEIGDGHELSLVDLNVNAHYIFELTHKLGIYPLGGLNYSIESERSDSESTERISEVGLNYGFGGHLNFHPLFVFFEFKGIAGQLNDTFVTAGLIFPLSRSQSAEEH